MSTATVTLVRRQSPSPRRRSARRAPRRARARAAVDAERPRRARSNSPAASARAHLAAARFPSFGPSTGRFGFTRSSTPRPARTRPPSPAAPRAISSTCSRRELGALDDEPAQRLAQLQPRLRARRAAQLDDAPHVGDLVERAPRPGARATAPASRARKTESGAPSHTPRTRFCQRCSARNGITGETTRSDCDERVPERAEGRLVERSRSAAASGGCTSSRGRRRTPRRRESRRRSASPRSASVASATSRSRARDSQRSSGRSSHDGPSSRSA